MNSWAKICGVTAISVSVGIVPAAADSCSGHNHDTGTALGAVGGGLIGGLATHSVVGGIGGAVIGGVAGNALSRGDDCHHRARAAAVRHYYTDRDGHRHYYYTR